MWTRRPRWNNELVKFLGRGISSRPALGCPESPTTRSQSLYIHTHTWVTNECLLNMDDQCSRPVQSNYEKHSLYPLGWMCSRTVRAWYSLHTLCLILS